MANHHSVRPSYRRTAQQFQQLFDTNVDMYVMGKEKRYSKAEAVSNMSKFFDTHKVNSFRMVHSGESRGHRDPIMRSHQLNTDKKNYRVYVYYNSEGGKKLINELRIEDN